jgi:DNA-binding response OmpR family regulator
VLVVEDNPDGREALRILLGLQGFAVEAAPDGEQGVQKALSWKPDAAVVDIGLPLLDGFEVARRVRAALGRGIVLIALSAYGTRDFWQRGRDAGFDVYLTKPTEPSYLRDLILERTGRANPDYPEPRNARGSSVPFRMLMGT